MNKIYKKGKTPIICGGTGFYIQAILYDIDFDENEIDAEYRKKLETFAGECGNEALHDKLKEVDKNEISAHAEFDDIDF